MKLILARKQTPHTDRKGRSEGVTFELSCRLDLNAHESELVTLYQRTEYPLGQVTDRQGDPRHSIITVHRLRDGMSISTRFVSDADETEDTVKRACAEFKALLTRLENYGGDEELEF